MTTIADDLKTLPVKQRLCYMDGERKLKFFKIYTQYHCEIECLSDKLKQICECVPFDIIRDNGTKVCELFDYICVERVKLEFVFEEDQSKLCNCIQPCNFISYSYEFVETKDAPWVTDGIARLNFKEKEFISMKRIREFTIFDFFSYVGGLLGLFTGISVLSLFEILYFFTLRLFVELYWLYKRKRIVAHEKIIF